MKLNWITLVAGVLVSVSMLTSCLGTTSSSTSDNAAITSFIINNDSIEGLDNVSLTIDNSENLIYNADSLAYGTILDSVYCTITGAKLGSVVINDSLFYSDTVAINMTQPLQIRSYAQNMSSYKDYTVKVSVHQVNPELFVWDGLITQIYSEESSADHAVYFNEELYLFVKTSSAIELYTSMSGTRWTSASTNLPAETDVYTIVNYGDKLAVVVNGSLYTSSNGTSWSEVATSGSSIESALFTLNSVLYGLSSSTSSANIIALQSDNSWSVVSAIPDGFPVSGAAMCVAPSPTGKYRAYLIGGTDASGNALQSVWSTENGNYYANLGGGNNPIPARTNAAVIQYDNGLMLFGGRDGSELIDSVLLYSPDYGINWFEPTEEMAISDLFAPRYGLSALVNDENRIFLIGGRNESIAMRNAWMGFKYAELPGFKTK